MYNLQREFFYCTPIFFHDVQNAKEINNKLLDNILDWKEKDKEGIIRSNNLGWHSSYDMNLKDEYQDIVNIINNKLDELSTIEEYNSRKKLVVHDMWANVSPKYAYNGYHIHTSSLWSGVYYVQSPPNCGVIKFTNYGLSTLLQPDYEKEHGNQQPHQWTTVEYEPIEGRVIFFPSWLGHEVQQNLTDVEGQDGYRISISFNSRQKEK
tara:strand:- start:34 stop:657 length:624 start_codon:yes stop_codon:yes gene_type:complete